MVHQQLPETSVIQTSSSIPPELSWHEAAAIGRYKSLLTGSAML